MRSALFGLLLILSAPALAEIYKYTNEQGNTVFTNQPPDDTVVDEVDLPPANTVDLQATEPPPQPTTTSQAEQQLPYRSLTIGGIPDEQALRANNGTFVVSAQLVPALKRGHRIRFMLDGIALDEPGTATSLQLTNVDRGEHTLAIEVLAADGQAIQRAEETFTVQRIHTSSPAR